MTVINSTPLVTAANTRLECLDASGQLGGDQLTVERLEAMGDGLPLPAAPSPIDSSRLVAEWNSSWAEARYGVYACYGSDPQAKVMTIKISRDGKF